MCVENRVTCVCFIVLSVFSITVLLYLILRPNRLLTLPPPHRYPCILYSKRYSTMESAMNLCKSLPVWVKATELVLCRDSLQRALRYVQGRERDETGDKVIAEGLIHGVDEARLRANQFFIEKIEMYVHGGGGECVRVCVRERGREKKRRGRKGEGGKKRRDRGRELQHVP